MKFTPAIRFRNRQSRDCHVLVTGGAGYIGSHTCLVLLEAGYKVVVVDNLCNSFKESLNRVQKIANKRLHFVKASVDDMDALSKVFETFQIYAVIHFAGLKAVSESIAQPLLYYHNNFIATCTLLQCMQKYNVHRIIFSSSATVYGNPDSASIPETAPTGPLTPYGRSKLMCEEAIRDVCTSNKNMCAAILRYFNPVGSHESGLIGENPRDAPNNLMPCVTRAMITGKPLNIFGQDYSTKDGTAIRDFIHVMDLARGHVAALRKVLKVDGHFCEIYNMGNGTGHSVMDVVVSMRDVSGCLVPHIVTDRRPGDAESVVADPSKAYRQLKWKPELALEVMCGSAWKWQSQNPEGYSYKVSMIKKISKLFICTV